MPSMVVLATLRQRGAVQAGRVEFDADSDGASDVTVDPLVDRQAQAAFSYSGEGTYTLTVRVYSPTGAPIYTASREITVSSPSLVASRALSVYQGMVGRLLNGDTSGAMLRITADSREKYQSIFNALGTGVSTAAAQLGRVEVRAVSGAIAELAVIRDGPQGPLAFPVHLIKSSDGLWRVEGM